MTSVPLLPSSWMSLVVTGLVLCQSVPGQANRRSVSHKVPVLHFCRVLFRGLPDERQLIASDHGKAEQHFRALTRSEIRRQLVPLRKSLYRGTFSYSSVAYVLAYYGVDTIDNARRMLYAFHLPKSAAPGMDAKDHQEMERDSEAGDTTSDELVRAIQRLYQHHSSDKLWELAVLAYEAGGTDSEGPPSDFAAAFLSYPVPLLRAFSRVPSVEDQTPDSIGELGDMIGRYGNDSIQTSQMMQYRQVRAVLHHLVQSKDRAIARSARKLHRAFDKSISELGVTTDRRKSLRGARHCPHRGEDE